MKDFEGFGELNRQEQLDLRLLDEIYPLQKSFSEGLKYLMWRKQETPLGPPEITDDEFELARKSFQTELSDWLFEASCDMDDQLATAHGLILQRCNEVKNDALNTFDIAPLPDDHAQIEKGLKNMRRHYNQYVNQQSVNGDVALRRTIAHTCEITMLYMMRDVFGAISDR